MHNLQKKLPHLFALGGKCECVPGLDVSGRREHHGAVEDEPLPELLLVLEDHLPPHVGAVLVIGVELDAITRKEQR